MHRLDASYLFRSVRLGFRTWRFEDIAPLANINSDPLVMQYFPKLIPLDETTGYIERMQTQFAEKGYCYFAVDLLSSNKFIGFIGISEQTFEAPFTPCTDIGWRLSADEWNKGYATEGATRCLQYAFTDLKIRTVHAVAPQVNSASIQFMNKIGMRKVLNFNHPKLIESLELLNCVLYKIDNNSKE